jgi:hypothetical protein
MTIYLVSGNLRTYPKIILSEVKDLAGFNILPVFPIFLHQILHFAQNDASVLGQAVTAISV